MLMEIQGQKTVSGCKNPFRTFYIAVMHYGVWLLIFLRKEQMQMKLVLAEKPSVAQSIAKVLDATKREDGYLEGKGYVVSWCVGIWWSWHSQKPMMRSTANGLMQTCLSSR